MRINAIAKNPNFGVKNPKYIPPEELIALTYRKNFRSIKVPSEPNDFMKRIPLRIKLKRLNTPLNSEIIKKESK